MEELGLLLAIPSLRNQRMIFKSQIYPHGPLHHHKCIICDWCYFCDIIVLLKLASECGYELTKCSIPSSHMQRNAIFVSVTVLTIVL